MPKQPVPYSSLDTPVVLVDMDKLETNIKEMQQIADEARVRLRPHTKIHESAVIAKMQLQAGACGIEVGPVDQAEVFADEGLENIVTSARYDNSQVIGIAGGIGSPREAEELRGQVSRYLESYPDHPALLILRTVSESLSKDRDKIIAKQNLLAAASSALTKYSVPEKEL